LIRFGGIGISVPTQQLLDKKPDVVVLNLFHKRALYTHIDKKYCIACKISELSRNYSELAAYIESNFTVEYQNNGRYFEELYKYISMLRDRLPSTRLLLLERFTPLICKGLTRQWIHDWDKIADRAPDFYRQCEEEFDVRLISTNSIFQDALSKGYTLDDLFPYLTPKIMFEEEAIQIEMERDLEHGTVAFWNMCGRAVLNAIGDEQFKDNDIVTPDNFYEIIRRAYQALLESVEENDPVYLRDFINEAINDSKCVDLTNYLTTAVLLFESSDIVDLVNGLRGDFRFSLATTFDYLDLLSGAIDLTKSRIIVVDEGDFTNRIMGLFPKSLKTQITILKSESLNVEFPEILSSLLLAEMTGVDTHHIVIASDVNKAKIEEMMNSASCNASITIIQPESVFFWLMKQSGNIYFNN